ncbi:hypothetical protein [Cohnella sp. AR92]|uniref:hypothetical protein n=1 Tax=Cohnella sp. AR92 TaxID=648716 RepID=UPI000F8E8EAC|nr:hypothetical protein [Cohnella sp. AR92]RUS46001.1 hypothetical protein ELR57_16245 [Cohnella sp. AR92]
MKRARDSLFQLEWSFHRHLLPLDARGRLLWVGVPILLIVASLIFLDGTTTARTVFAIGVSLSALLALFLGTKPVLTLWENPYKDWWLTIPVKREELMRAKLNAAIRFQAYASLAIWATCAASSLIRLASGSLDSDTFSAGSFLLDAFAYLVFCIPVTVLFVCAGFSFVGMYGGRRVWLNIPFVLVYVVLFSVLPAIGDHSLRLDRWLGGDLVFAYSLAGVLLAATVYRSTLRFTARYGPKDLASYRMGGANAGKKDALTGRGSRTQVKPRRAGFASVYALEWSRYRYFLSLLSVRIIVAALFAAMIAGGFFASNSHDTFLDVFHAILLPICIAPSLILVILNQHEANKKRMAWWLCLPYDRRALLLSRLLASWGVALRILATLVGAFLTGVIARVLVIGLPYSIERTDVYESAYTVFFYFVAGLVMSSVVLAQPYSFRRPLFSWIYGPISSAMYLIPALIENKLLPEASSDLGIGTGRWLALLAIAVLVVPLGIFSLRIGARWAHLYLLNTQDAAGRRRHLEADGKIIGK